MEINGEFVLREIVGEYVLVPVGETALKFNGIISLNEVGALIWKGLCDHKSREEILKNITDEFEVSDEDASGDMDEFLASLRESGILK